MAYFTTFSANMLEQKVQIATIVRGYFSGVVPAWLAASFKNGHQFSVMQNYQRAA
jgi:hypothetical protein